MNEEERTITLDFKKYFNIDIDEIQLTDGLIEQIAKAIAELTDKATYERLEVVLNENLISTKDILDNYRTILGCRVSYKDLENNISFIVREDKQPTYEQLQQENKQLKEKCEFEIKCNIEFAERIDKAIEYIEYCLEENCEDSCDYLDNHYIAEKLIEILKGDSNE